MGVFFLAREMKLASALTLRLAREMLLAGAVGLSWGSDAWILFFAGEMTLAEALAQGQNFGQGKCRGLPQWCVGIVCFP